VKAGFWHVGVKQTCNFSDSNQSLAQVVWVARVTKTAEGVQNQPCTPPRPEDDRGPNFGTETDPDKIFQCGFA
jgi:hypothetical protein